MKPEGNILDAQIARTLIEWRNNPGVRHDNLKHSLLYYSTKSKKQGQSVPENYIYIFVWGIV